MEVIYPLSESSQSSDTSLISSYFNPFPETPFYVNLHVSNQSPGETVFFPVKESPESGFHLNPGTAMNIKETVDSGNPMTYIALSGDNHKPLLLNDQAKLTVTPDANETFNTDVNITKPRGMKASSVRVILRAHEVNFRFESGNSRLYVFVTNQALGIVV